MSDETLDALFTAIWKLRDVGWTSEPVLLIKCFSESHNRWQVGLGRLIHNGDDLADAAAGLYQDLRQKAEDHVALKQAQAELWRSACDYPVPAWAWPGHD